jgi:hypothetical protein
MLRHSAVPSAARHFVLGVLSGVLVSLVAGAGLTWLGLLPRESEALLLSADYRLSRNETELREHVRYLERELELLRRSRTISASSSSRAGS